LPRGPGSLARDIQEALGIPSGEAELYVKTVLGGPLAPVDEETKETARALSARGMFILDAKGERYLAVHPRMALSNLFRAYEERAVRERKERRLVVDRITLELMALIPEESKSTNAGDTRGAGTAKG
jgi:hypothetical protein